MTNLPSPEITALDRAILHTVIYADVFDYPLRAAEIHRYLTGLRATPEAVGARLLCLVPESLCRSGDCFTLPGREEIVAKRERREAIALRLWPQAVRYGNIIARLPFVRMLAVTGSLSMNNVETGADLDYLIVTRAGRLWMCRAMILAVGRLAELQGIRICPNYLISEHALELPERSLYAAHELAQMVPLAGWAVYNRMRSLNAWVADFLPNAAGAPINSVAGEDVLSMVRSAVETVLLTPAGSWIEELEMERKIRKLRGENSNNAEAGFSKDICKGHFNRHGLRTEHVLREKLESFSLEVSR